MTFRQFVILLKRRGIGNELCGENTNYLRRSQRKDLSNLSRVTMLRHELPTSKNQSDPSRQESDQRVSLLVYWLLVSQIFSVRNDRLWDLGGRWLVCGVNELWVEFFE